MPVKPVRGPRGRMGYRFGESGTIYYGPGARERAQRQGRAISAAGYRSPAPRKRTK